jgi:hypothetical protein
MTPAPATPETAALTCPRRRNTYLPGTIHNRLQITAVMHGWRPWPNSKRARPSWMICALRSPQADVVRGCVDAVWAT